MRLCTLLALLLTTGCAVKPAQKPIIHPSNASLASYCVKWVYNCGQVEERESICDTNIEIKHFANGTVTLVIDEYRPDSCGYRVYAIATPPEAK